MILVDDRFPPLPRRKSSLIQLGLPFPCGNTFLEVFMGTLGFSGAEGRAQRLGFHYGKGRRDMMF